MSKEHTKRGLEKIWGQEEAAKSRAKREASSAPTKEELEVFERCLIKSIKNATEPKAIILGATPELRDLAIKHGCQTIAVDISLPIINTMTEIMNYGLNEKDIAVRGDCLTQHQYLKKENFDVVMADGLINNLPFEGNYKIFRILYQLLKPNGQIIIRNIVWYPKRSQKSIEEIAKWYENKEINWLDLLLSLGYYSPLVYSCYDPEKKEFHFSKFFEAFNNIVRQGKIKLTEHDQDTLNNVMVSSAARSLVHIVFSEKEFKKITEAYFEILPVEQHKKCGHIHSDFLPIWFMRKKSS